MYISLTKGASGDKANAISEELLQDQLKCFHLYCCFNEANDHRMCNTIEQLQASIFDDKIISTFRYEIAQAGIATTDMEHISLFLALS